MWASWPNGSHWISVVKRAWSFSHSVLYKWAITELKNQQNSRALWVFLHQSLCTTVFCFSLFTDQYFIRNRLSCEEINTKWVPKIQFPLKSHKSNHYFGRWWNDHQRICCKQMINAFALSSPKCAKSDSETSEISTELSRFVPDLSRFVKRIWKRNKCFPLLM